jgi:hypothetical protein
MITNTIAWVVYSVAVIALMFYILGLITGNIIFTLIGLVFTFIEIGIVLISVSEGL